MEHPVPHPTDTESAPLLPAILLRPASFIWLWWLPLLVLGLLNWQGYWLVGPEMTPEQRGRALTLGVAWLVDLTVGIVTYVLARRERADGAVCARVWWALPGLLTQIAYLWLAVASLAEGLWPRTLGAWIYSDARFLFHQFAFCMLPAFHGVLRLAAARLPKKPGRELAWSVSAAIGAPVLLYLLLHGLSLLSWQGRDGEIGSFVFATVLMLAGVAMFVGVLRGLLALLRRVRDWRTAGEPWAVALFALVLPLAGLALNREIPFPVDFQAVEVYALTVANAAVMFYAVCLGATRARLRWWLLCATLPFSLYFFLVFLPYTPLSVLAVIVLGVGFLVLTPVLLFALHLHLLRHAWRDALACEPRWRLLAGGVLAALALPGFFTARNLADKVALNAALAHLHDPVVASGQIEYQSSRANLRRALDSHRAYKDGLYYPLLSDYYAWLVFDNLVLPDRELNDVERVFFGATNTGDEFDPLRHTRGRRERASDGTRLRRVAAVPQTVTLEKQAVKAAVLDAGTSLVTLALTLRNTGAVPAEYVEQLRLPPGVIVRGFRLQVGETLVPGRIFERKTALWVYAMIRDWSRRDPGVLSYRAPGELELRVFPVAPDKPTAVELDLLVPARLADAEWVTSMQAAPTLNVALALIGEKMPAVATRASDGGRIVAGLDALHLPATARGTYLHVIVDRSEENGFTGDGRALHKRLQAWFPQATTARVTAANYEVASVVSARVPLEKLADGIGTETARALPLRGGLALDLALAHALRQHRDRDLDLGERSGRRELPPQPIFVIVSRHARQRAVELSLADAWADLVPGLTLCEIGADGSFVTHRRDAREEAPLLRVGNSARPLATSGATRFAAGQEGVLRAWSATEREWREVAMVSETNGGAWAEGERLLALQQDFDRSPGEARLARRDLVVAARRAGVLLPATSYIVVENQSQWRMLEKSERQKLGQNAALDFVETPAPSLLWCGGGLVVWLIGRRLKPWRRLGLRRRDRTVNVDARQP